jgi:hypothetical protein
VPRIRTIKPQFFHSPDTARASPRARLLYVAMWCWANDWGIGETNINGLLGMAFPDSDGITKDELLLMLAEVRDAYGVVFYTVRERHYFCIPTWDDHQTTQRRASLRFPTYDDPESISDLRIPNKLGISEHEQGNDKSGKGKGKGNITTQVSTEVTVVEGGMGGDVPAIPTTETAPAKAVARTRGGRIPDSYMPSDQTIEVMRKEFPNITRSEWESEHRQFCDYWHSQPGAKGTKLDWDATWRGWMRREFRKPQYERRVTNTGQRLSTVDQKIVNLQAMKEPE